MKLQRKILLTNIFFVVTATSLFLSYSVGHAEDLIVAFPGNLPPWTLKSCDGGITLEIVRKSLHNSGHNLRVQYLSLKQLNDRIVADADAHAQVESKKVTGYYSDELIEFNTSLISLSPNKYNIQNISDLYDKNIIAFPNASQLFGSDFQSMTQVNPFYEEMADQELQVVNLYNDKTDLILIDRNVFLYFRNTTSMTNTSMPITYHHIPGLTEKSPTFVVFKQKEMRDDFNNGLRQLKNNGDYYDIFYKYTR